MTRKEEIRWPLQAQIDLVKARIEYYSKEPLCSSEVGKHNLSIWKSTLNTLELTAPESSPIEKKTTKSMKTTKGLYNRYIIQKTNGEPIDKNAEYFVLRLDKGGDDPKHIDACRRAIQIYAANIYGHLTELAHDIMVKWPVDQKDPHSDDPRINKLNLIAQKYGSANFVAAYVDQNNVEEIVLEAMSESSPAPLESQEELWKEIAYDFSREKEFKIATGLQDLLKSKFTLMRNDLGNNQKGRTEGDLEEKN